MAGFNDAPLLQSLAVPAVCMLIAFLGYFSQYIFYNSTLEPGPPTNDEIILFNALLLSLWYTYFKAVSVNPGVYEFPGKVIEADGNWCKKCAAPKPARAHHCRHCGRCIPKMDHHCPWTANCVSMSTFPHFLRFLVFANVSLWVLGTLLWQRLYALWEARNLPAYLGPTLQALIALALISLICAVTSLALGIMLITTVKGWLFNCTMIEGWQLERHEALTEQGDRYWWDMTDLEGKKIKFEKVEFPYDIGFFANMSQAMGTSNILLWFLPFSGNPTVSREGKGSGWDWEENGFNRKEGMWPPLDPEKIRGANRSWATERRDFDAELRDVHLSPEETKRAFKERQEQDARRRNLLVAELEEIDDYDLMDEKEDTGYSVGGTRWTNTEGERLSDYGVDDDSDRSSVDNVPDDDVPLADLLRRRKVAQATTAD